MAQSQDTSNPFTLSAEQLDAFAERGVIKLPGLMSAEIIQRAREAVLARLATFGLWRDGAWQLDAVPRPASPANGLKTRKVIGNKRPEIEALIEDPALLAVVDQLLEGRKFDRRIFKRPQVLFTLPNADVWRVPDGWHTDGVRLASGMRPGVQLFGFLDHVDAGGGGTVIVAGSHRLANDGRYLRQRDLLSVLRREPFFRELLAGRGGEGGELPRARIGDVLVEVMELTGAPGDAWLIDLRTLHSGAANAADRPRLMFTYRFWRRDALREAAQANGWIEKNSSG